MNSSVIMIVGIAVVTLFIGIAIQPAISGFASSLNDGRITIKNEEMPCNCEKQLPKDAGCKTCIEAVFHAVKIMKINVTRYFQYLISRGVYLLWTMDLTLEIYNALKFGLQDSGFKINIDYNELKEKVEKTISKLCGSDKQLHNITLISAKILAIYIGIALYLLTFCI